MAQGIIFSSKVCLEYHFPGHPESPERFEKTYDYLLSKKHKILTPETAEENDILLVHTAEHIDSVKDGTFFDPDTPFSPNIYKIALLSSGGALSALKSAIDGIPALSFMRPPGHHAGRIIGVSGFCYFNNIAVSVMRALDQYERVAILDIDAHHGNGTEEIFSGNKNVLLCSLHQVPLYPGSGTKSYKNCLNFPLPPGTKEDQYLTALETALKEIQKFSPQLIAVSAGFDTYKKDPLASMELDISTYKKIGKRISDLNLPRYAVLEGGYSPDLPYCVESFLEGFF